MHYYLFVFYNKTSFWGTLWIGRVRLKLEKEVATFLWIVVLCAFVKLSTYQPNW